jgi:hypothetical protein
MEPASEKYCLTCSRSFMSFTPKAMSIGTTEDRVLVAAARYGLGELEVPIVVNAADAERVLFRARFDRLTGMLATAVLGDVVSADDVFLSALRKQWHDELLTCVRLEALAVRTADLLNAAGINWRITKGAALAHLDYPDPAARTFGDVDMVVHPSDWPQAFRLLSANGYRRDSVTLPGDYDNRYGKGATLTTADGLEVDLHRRFAIGRFGVTSRMESLFASSGTVELAGRALPVLAPEGRLLHACFHATLGGFRALRAFRDVAQLILVTGADWQATYGLARSWRAEAVVVSAIKETWDRLELSADHPAHTRAVATRMSRGDQRALRLFARGSTFFRSQALSALRRLPPYEVPRYLWSLGHARRRRNS